MLWDGSRKEEGGVPFLFGRKEKRKKHVALRSYVCHLGLYQESIFVSNNAAVTKAACPPPPPRLRN